MRWLLVGLIVLCNAAGDILNTLGMRRHGEVHEFHPGALGKLVATLARNLFVIGGIVANALSFFALLALLSIATLSFAIPATAMSFLLETVLAKYLLKERVGWKRWAGALLVIGGVVLLAL